ncbi:hypothetical protein [Stakelama tenebrarum]|uniref:Uncharacterized protein n=1 Tax=Stakelama tenebrarum TaxID=2711215 RepID=A0A6G6Y4L2_9SPHN|nr:hypothetical protein [Sphingosinithalassobacter tenebrarum]QIG79543.1 hypothetical protein G5C33_06900 [Sphingosinithalassobacter tenebrarum]
MSEGGLSFALVGTGGSSGRTLAAVERSIRERRPDARFLFVDTQPFNLRTRGTTRYDGGGDVVLVSPEDCGIRSRTGSQTTNLLLSGGPIAYARLVNRMATLLGRRHDALILCHDRMYAETGLVRAAHRLGTPTALLQEGPFCAIGHGRPQNRTLRLKAALAPVVNFGGLIPPIPDYGCAGHDKVLAASSAYRDKWIAAGVSAEKIDVVGIPRYDALAALRLSPDPLPEGRPLRLLYLVQPFAAHGKVDAAAAERLQQVFAEGLNRVVGDVPFELTIRAHPRSGRDDVATLAAQLTMPVIRDAGDAPLEAVLEHTDVVIGHYSSGLLETLLLGRRILCLPVPADAFAERSEADKQLWMSGLGAPVARTPGEVEIALRRLSNGEGGAVSTEKLSEEAGLVDGQAAARCAQSILELAGLKA